MLRDILACIVCGAEHSGTTIVKEILQHHSQLDSGVEYGLLVNPTLPEYKTSKENRIFYERYPKTWGLSYEDIDQIIAAPSLEEAYRLTKKLSHVSNDETVRLIDKTPKYVYLLEKHIFSLIEDVPVIVMKRDPRNFAGSYMGRRDLAADFTCVTYNSAYEKFLDESYQQQYGDRYRMFQFEDFLANPAESLAEMLDYIGLPFEDSFNQQFFDEAISNKPLYDHKLLNRKQLSAIKKMVNPAHYINLKKY